VTLRATENSVKQIVFLVQIKLPYPNFSFSGDKKSAQWEIPPPGRSGEIIHTKPILNSPPEPFC
jgi:hypothetical protein